MYNEPNKGNAKFCLLFHKQAEFLTLDKKENSPCQGDKAEL